MREYLIRLYCTIGEIQKQKENTETEKFKKQMEEMRRSMAILQEKNKNFRTEVELVKNKVYLPRNLKSRESEKIQGTKAAGKDNRNDKNKAANKEKGSVGDKRNSQPSVTPINSKNRNRKIRR